MSLFSSPLIRKCHPLPIKQPLLLHPGLIAAVGGHHAIVENSSLRLRGQGPWGTKDNRKTGTQNNWIVCSAQWTKTTEATKFWTSRLVSVHTSLHHFLFYCVRFLTVVNYPRGFTCVLFSPPPFSYFSILPDCRIITFVTRVIVLWSFFLHLLVSLWCTVLLFSSAICLPSSLAPHVAFRTVLSISWFAMQS